MEQEVRLLIGIASGRGWSAKTGYSLAQLMFYLGLNKLGGRLQGVELNVHMQAYLCVARNELICAARDRGFTHFLSLDDDMVFPCDLVDRMLAQNKPIVTCNYRKKLLDKVEGTVGDLEGRHLNGGHGLERVASMGMGAVLIQVSALKDMQPPFFAVVWNPEKKQYVIEDGVFSRLLGEAGVEIWCDHELSKEVGHMGEIEYRFPPQVKPLDEIPLLTAEMLAAAV